MYSRDVKGRTARAPSHESPSRSLPTLVGKARTIATHAAVTTTEQPAIVAQLRRSRERLLATSQGVKASVTKAINTFRGPITVLAPRMLPTSESESTVPTNAITVSEAASVTTNPKVTDSRVASRSRRPILAPAKSGATRRPTNRTASANV